VRCGDRSRQGQTGMMSLWTTGIIPLEATWRRADRKPVRWALHSLPAAIQDMDVNHRGTYIGTPEQLLHGSDVGRGERVTKSVRPAGLKEPLC
jgi:hypothetical protein